MGLLTEGKPLAWNDSKPWLEHVKHHGWIQFLNTYRRLKDRKKDVLMWGDEVEYSVLVKTDEGVRLSLRAPEILKDLGEREKECCYAHVLWRPEYANWMIEATPGTPYRCYVADLLVVEASMSLRRKLVESVLRENERCVTLTTFPRLGCENFTDPPTAPGGKFSNSAYMSDAVTNPHPRFGTLTQNIRTRRGSNVDIRYPIFQDERTPDLIPEMHNSPDGTTTKGMAGDVHMDAMGFGMGASCLQVTMQARDIKEARHLYDQLAVLGPIMLALSAAAPIWRGYLTDCDVRWNVISNAVDCRTDEERTRPVGEGGIRTSRYSSIDMYMSLSDALDEERYNDVPVVINDECYEFLKKEGVDERLARHVAHLFIRDPLVIYENTLHQDDNNDTDHFENVQSTNWNSVRFKPPPPNSDIGWRVEFRTMEVQLTDFENAALAIFIVLVSRVIIAFDLNLYIPISLVDENMDRAHERDACASEKFWFRKSPITGTSFLPTGFKCVCGKVHSPTQNLNFTSVAPEGQEWTQMSIAEIMNGSHDFDHDHDHESSHSFPGLVPLVHSYLDTIKCVGPTRLILNCYLDFIKRRAAGELMTDAAYIRKFVREHPAYKKDSVVSEEIQNDLMDACHLIGTGKMAAPEILSKEGTIDTYSIPLCDPSKETPWDRDAMEKQNAITRRLASMLVLGEGCNATQAGKNPFLSVSASTSPREGEDGNVSPVLMGSSLREKVGTRGKADH
eukprot:Rmarinus@m.24135